MLFSNIIAVTSQISNAQRNPIAHTHTHTHTHSLEMDYLKLKVKHTINRKKSLKDFFHYGD